jgi:hypothetical protein
MYRGDRMIKAKKKVDNDIVDIYGEMSDVFDDVAYQGGFPPMPKPARLSLGVAANGLVLYDREGNNGLVGYDKINKVDRFVTQAQRKYKFGLMAYGPIALVLNRPMYRHFFTAEYIDVNNEKNIIMVLLKSREVAENLYQSVTPYLSKGKRKK